MLCLPSNLLHLLEIYANPFTHRRLDWWLEYMDEKWNKAINRDLWRQTLRFARETMQDDSMSFWNEESSWPSVVDDFVEWVKTEKRANGANLGAEDAMDVE